jgi:hypothetical protein
MPGRKPLVLHQFIIAPLAALNKKSRHFRLAAKKPPKFGRGTEDQMIVRHIQKFGLGVFYPFIGHYLAAGVAEPGFAGMGDKPLFAAAGTGVDAVSHFILIAAGHNPPHFPNNHIANAGPGIIFVLIIKPFPEIFEDLFDCIFTVGCKTFKHIQ